MGKRLRCDKCGELLPDEWPDEKGPPFSDDVVSMLKAHGLWTAELQEKAAALKEEREILKPLYDEYRELAQWNWCSCGGVFR